ncbi:MAG TPA: ABC transporter substrate-binding protein [Streptosporangiaceae bacterium]|jgi:osmoprotectant transport system substrate-binding protein
MHRITSQTITRSGRKLTTKGPARFRAYAAAGLAVAVAASLSACGNSSPLAAKSGSSSGPVVIGAANFYESDLLATIYQLALQGNGIKATTKLNIGAREIYYPQVKKGALSIVPEYNGALLTTSVDTTSTAATTTEVDAALKSDLPSSLEILNPSAAQDADSVTVTAATAAKYHLTSTSSIGALAPYAKNMVFGGPSEFNVRSDGIPGLKKNYGLTFKSFKTTDESSTVTFTDLTNNVVQAADVFTTSPQIITDHLVSLADPKFNFAAQNVIPLVYKPAMSSKIVSTLNAISADLTTEALLQMDKAYVVDHASYNQIASGFLAQEHLK